MSWKLRRPKSLFESKACLRNSWCQLGAGVYYGRLKGVGVNLGRGVNLVRNTSNKICDVINNYYIIYSIYTIVNLYVIQEIPIQGL